MRTWRLVAAAVIASFIGARATGFQSTGFAGGFEDAQLAPDIYRVSFSGNAFTSSDRVQDFALLRAAELTLANKAQYFAIMS